MIYYKPLVRPNVNDLNLLMHNEDSLFKLSNNHRQMYISKGNRIK